MNKSLELIMPHHANILFIVPLLVVFIGCTHDRVSKKLFKPSVQIAMTDADSKGFNALSIQISPNKGFYYMISNKNGWHTGKGYDYGYNYSITDQDGYSMRSRQRIGSTAIGMGNGIRFSLKPVDDLHIEIPLAVPAIDISSIESQVIVEMSPIIYGTSTNPNNSTFEAETVYLSVYAYFDMMNPEYNHSYAIQSNDYHGELLWKNRTQEKQETGQLIPKRDKVPRNNPSERQAESLPNDAIPVVE